MIKKLSLLMTITLFLVYGCKKDVISVNCERCKWVGTYSGTFHDVAGCYGCVPYIDSTYNGNFVVDTLSNDSIIIIRTYDNYEWRFAYTDTGKYSRWGCCTVGESFEFILPDTLTYFYNNGGSGGYFRQEFTGNKN
jgi:hypothetical protein